MLNKDCLTLIFKYYFFKLNDFKVLRLVCKDYFEVAQLLWFQPIERIYPPYSFINMSACSICGDTPNKNKTVPYGRLPRPIYIYCDKYHCSRTTIRNLVDNAKEENKVILLKEAVLEFGKCIRSNGSLSECMFMRGWMWNSRHIRCLLGNLFKDTSLDKIPEEYKLKYKILKL